MSPHGSPRTPDLSRGLDASFFRRIYVVSALFSALGGLLMWGRGEAMWALGFFAYGLWATANIWALARVLSLVVKPGRSALDLIGALALKVPVLYGIGFFLLWRGGFPPVSVVSGISVPLVVIFLKVLGRIITPRLANPSPNSR